MQPLAQEFPSGLIIILSYFSSLVVVVVVYYYNYNAFQTDSDLLIDPSLFNSNKRTQ